MAITFHPMLPRKPFARILDRAELLGPILSDAMHRVLVKPADGKTPGPELPESEQPECPQNEKLVLIARWAYGGHYQRYSTNTGRVLRLFFARGSMCMPRPGD